MPETLNWIFVLGCQRSGTTLTGQILGAHSKCLLIDEPHDLYSLFETGNAAHVQSRISEIALKVTEKYVDRSASLSQAQTYNLVAKAPNLTYLHSELAHLSPTPKIIYPVRDVRIVVASMLAIADKRPILKRQTGFILDKRSVFDLYKRDMASLADSGTPDHVRAATIWKIETNACANFSSVGLEPLWFRYEDLIMDPVAYAQKFAVHCDMNFEREMLDYPKVLSGIGAGFTPKDRAIDKHSLNKWEKQLSADQVKHIIQIAESAMRRFGYLSLAK